MPEPFPSPLIPPAAVAAAVGLLLVVTGFCLGRLASTPPPEPMPACLRVLRCGG